MVSLLTDKSSQSPRAAAKLGYPDLMCNVQSSSYEPSARLFGSAMRG